MGKKCRDCIRLLAGIFSELSAAATYRELGKEDNEAYYLDLTKTDVETLYEMGCIPAELKEGAAKALDAREYSAAWSRLVAATFLVASRCQREHE